MNVSRGYVLEDWKARMGIKRTVKRTVIATVVTTLMTSGVAGVVVLVTEKLNQACAVLNQTPSIVSTIETLVTSITGG